MKKLDSRLIPIVMLLLAMAWTTGFADRRDRDRHDRWETLGRAQVDGPRDHDTIVAGREGRRLRQLRLEVHGDPIEIHDMVVTFRDGKTYKPDLRQRLDDRSSRVIDLPGDRRGVQKVDLAYGTTRKHGRSTVTLYGR